MRTKIYLFAFSITTVLFFCDEGTDEFQKNKGLTLFSWIDQTRVRKNPNFNEKAIANLVEGESVQWNGQQSTESYKIVLREKNLDAPFYKVTLQSGLAGWVYGGALSEEYPKIEASGSKINPPNFIRILRNKYSRGIIQNTKGDDENIYMGFYRIDFRNDRAGCTKLSQIFFIDNQVQEIIANGRKFVHFSFIDVRNSGQKYFFDLDLDQEKLGINKFAFVKLIPGAISVNVDGTIKDFKPGTYTGTICEN